MTLGPRTIVSGWLVSTGAEKGPLAQAIAGPSRSGRPASSMRGERERGRGLAKCCIQPKGGQFGYQNVWNRSPPGAPVSISSRTNKITKGQQTTLSACVHKSERTKAAINKTRHGSQGPLHCPVSSCVLTTIKVNLALVDPARQASSNHSSPITSNLEGDPGFWHPVSTSTWQFSANILNPLPLAGSTG